MENFDLKKHAKILIILAYIGITLYVLRNFLPQVLSLFMPFILAYIVAMITAPLKNFLMKKLHWHNTIAAIFSWVLCLILVLTVVGFVAYKLIAEIVSIAKASPEYVQNISAWISAFSSKYGVWKNGLNQGYIEVLDNAVIQVSTTLFEALKALSANLVGYTTDFAKNLPNLLLFAIIFILASFFMCKDFEWIKKQIAMQIPFRNRDTAYKIKESSSHATLRYLRGMGIMLCIVFSIVFIGLLILKVPYAFFLALVLAVFDILPLFGTALILIPWGVISLLQANWFLGIGLISLCAINALIRQFSEPKVMSDSLGLYPIVTLIAVYLGMRLIGFAGVIVFPIIFLIVFKLQKAGLFTIWKTEDK